MTPNETFSAPEPLTDEHLLDQFGSGMPILDDWLRRRAIGNQATGATRSFVVCRDMRVIGYYALAAAAIASNEAPGRLRRNMPDPIPMVLLGRLAIDRQEQGKQLGTLLLRDAVRRIQQVSHEIGIVGILVHAIADAAKRFYLRRGFVEAPSSPMTLVARLKDLEA